MSKVLIEDCVLPRLQWLDRLLFVSHTLRKATLKELSHRLATADRRVLCNSLNRASQEAHMLVRCAGMCSKLELEHLVRAAHGMAPELLAHVVAANNSLSWQPFELIALLECGLDLPQLPQAQPSEWLRHWQ